MQNTQDLSGKVAYITGGSKGIGFGIAEALLAQGMKVAFSSRKLSSALAAAEKLAKDDATILALESDVTSLESEQKAVQSIIDHFGQLDVVIANAGVGHFAAIDELTAEQWNSTIDTNLTGVFNTTKATISELKNSKGYLITIASLAGTNFFAQGAAYNASKFGLVGFSQAVMLDVRDADVKVTTIMPGSVRTHFNGNDPSKKGAWKIQPEDIGQLTVDLLKMHPRTLPSKVEVRPSKPPSK